MYDYKALERKLLDLVDLLEPRLSPEERREIRSYVDFNEYGVAFEYLCELLGQKNVSLDPRAYTLIEEAGRQMELPPSTWSGLAPRVTNTSPHPH
jgi:hypothetical protein